MRKARTTTNIRCAAVLLLAGPAANATDSICTAVATRSTEATDDHPYPLKAGAVVDAITALNVDKKTGKAEFCSHGGGCYPADALRLSNCKVDRSRPFDDGPETSYGLVLIRSKVSPEALRQHDVELKLLGFGMCNVCADNAAAFYVKMPASRCAALVRRGLEGDPDAVAKLKDGPDYCTE